MIRKLSHPLFDGVGLAASSFCIVHCMATAALGFLLPDELCANDSKPR